MEFTSLKDGLKETEQDFLKAVLYIQPILHGCRVEFVVSKNSVLGAGQYPKRLVFPDVEISTNPNTPAQVPITMPVWWGL